MSKCCTTGCIFAYLTALQLQCCMPLLCMSPSSFHLWFHMTCNVYCRVCMFLFDTQYVLQGVYGAGAHTDYGAFTVLATDDNPGLQIYTGGKWQHVKPVPGTFVINLGDMLER